MRFEFGESERISDFNEKLKEIQNMPCNPRDWYVNSWIPKIQIWEKCPGGKRMVCECRDESYTAFLCCAANNYQDLVERIRELEAENARLKKQCEHLACDVVSAAQDYSAPMSDCRICDYDNFCRRKPGQVEPDVELCEEAVLKACDPKEAGE